MPIISVVMPVYNAEPFLEKSLNSVLNQTFKDWELICVDDCSIDNSLRILRNFSSNNFRIKIYSQETKSLGHSKALNQAIKLAQGKYIFPLDADDFISSDVLLNTFNKINETCSDLCLPDMDLIDTNANSIKKIIGYKGERDLILPNKKAVEYSLKWELHVKGLWRSNILKENLFDEEGFSAEFSSRQQLLKCNRITFSEGVYYYVQHPNAITKRIGPRIFYYLEIERKVKKLLVENNFEDNIISEYEWQRFQNIISKMILYYKNQKELDPDQKKIITSWFRTNYNDITAKLMWKFIDELPFKKKLIYNLILWNYIILNTYCYLKSK